ncbi:hypothetical protein T484DRAFT_1850225, partial [Baffinella frigidus]
MPRDLLQDRSVGVRRAEVLRTARAGEADGAQRLAQALAKEEDGTVRAEMIKGLVLLSGKGADADPQVVQAIIPFLEDAVPAVRIAAQTALGISSIAEGMALATHQAAKKPQYSWGPIPKHAALAAPPAPDTYLPAPARPRLSGIEEEGSRSAEEGRGGSTDPSSREGSDTVGGAGGKAGAAGAAGAFAWGPLPGAGKGAAAPDATEGKDAEPVHSEGGEDAGGEAAGEAGAGGAVEAGGG